MGIYKANTEIHDIMKRLVRANHPDLVDHLEEIVVAFKDKAGKSGGQVIYGQRSKVSDVVNALAGEDFKFMLLIGADKWSEALTSRQQEALLDHLLCGCGSEFDEKSGDYKLRLYAPDIVAYRENVERYGMWFPREEEESDQPPIDPVAASVTGDDADGDEGGDDE